MKWKDLSLAVIKYADNIQPSWRQDMNLQETGLSISEGNLLLWYTYFVKTYDTLKFFVKHLHGIGYSSAVFMKHIMSPL